METVDLIFPLVGTSIGVDHGYSLYAAISRLIPSLHEHPQVGIHPIRGQPAPNGKLVLTRNSSLQIRTKAEMIPALLLLSGKELAIDGQVLRVGVPHVMALLPAANLASRLVTIKGFMEPDVFIEAARRQLDDLGISRDSHVGIPAAKGAAPADKPTRRVLQIKDKTIVGFAVQVTGLAANESLMLQEAGLGGRRHMGCGIFKPFRGSPSD